MSLLQDWRDYAYGEEMAKSPNSKKFWDTYYELEKGIYAKLLENPDEVVEGTVEELAEKYDVKLSMMVGFLDGINESLKEKNPILDMEKDTLVRLPIEPEELYYNMVAAKANWLYELPQWDKILTAEKRKELYWKQKKSNTVVGSGKVGRNEPCPCGSGKKYKQCCGK
ncbi:MAG: SEC-C domain-containing protein [Lachnoclostridium sp.]|nr:SEC-C domain-containing protein [Lachnoclostridium sp.]